MSYYLKQPTSNGNCACGGDCLEQPLSCDDASPTIDSTSCVSVTATSATLRGWSKITNFNSGDWNMRKTLRRDQSGTTYKCFYGSSANGTPCGSEVFADMTGVAWGTVSGYSGFNVTSNAETAFVGSRSGYNWESGITGGTKPTCGSGHSSGDTWTPYWSYAPISQCNNTIIEIQTDDFHKAGSWLYPTSPRSASVTDDYSVSIGSAGCVLMTSGNCVFDPTPADHGGSAAIAYSTFDTVANAIIRGTETTGSSCKTYAGTITNTTSQSKTQITIASSPRAVTVTINASGLLSGFDFDIGLTIARYVAGGGAYVDDIYDTVTFTATNTTANITYEVPVNTDYDYEFSSANINCVPA